MTPQQMIDRLRDMGRYWDDGKPSPLDCADMIEELHELVTKEKQAYYDEWLRQYRRDNGIS